jgi:hypothetical protein
VRGEVLGAGLACIGTGFISCASAAVTDVPCSWLKPSLREGGYDESSPQSTAKIDFSDVHGERKPWKDVYRSREGPGQIDQVAPVQEVADQLVQEYDPAARS